MNCKDWRFGRGGERNIRRSFLKLSLDLSNVADWPAVILLVPDGRRPSKRGDDLNDAAWFVAARSAGGWQPASPFIRHLQVDVSDRLVLVIVNE